jgi:hypothetical protein
VGLLEQFESRLDRLVNGAFAKAFRAEVQPVEIAAALQREMDDRAAVIGRDRTVVPNLFRIELSAHDHDRLTSFEETIVSELVTVVTDHAAQQRYVPLGSTEVILGRDEQLDTGVFRVTSESKGGPTATESAALFPGSPRLVLANGVEHPLTSPTVRLGRGADVDIRLDDPSVSRAHAEITLGTPATIRDLGSTNGTFVDGSKVGEATLNDGSRVTLGTLTLTYRAG